MDVLQIDFSAHGGPYLVVCLLALLFLLYFPSSWAKSIYHRVRRIFLPILLCAVGLYAVTLPALAQVGGYPGGTRDPDAWYFCQSGQWNESGSSFTGIPWTEMGCIKLPFDTLPGGGGFQSVRMQAQVQSTLTDAEAIRLQGFVIPPRGIKSVETACTAAVQGYNEGTGSFNAGAEFINATGWSGGSNWSTSMGNPPAGQTSGSSIDVVDNRTATTYDRWWDFEPVSGWTASGGLTYPRWEIEVVTTSDNRQGFAQYDCVVIGWESWAQWLVDHPEWEPDEDDLLPEPTPVGPIDWLPEPWVPITNPVGTPVFEVTPPVGEICYVIIPSITIGENTSTGVEWCVSEWEIAIEIFGYDVGAALVIAFGVAATGILFAILRAP